VISVGRPFKAAYQPRFRDARRHTFIAAWFDFAFAVLARG
jgi:hypothetical protein